MSTPTPMHEAHRQSLSAVNTYITYLGTEWPNGEHGADSFILVLKIYRQVLKNRGRTMPADLEWLPVLKNGVRTSERLLKGVFQDAPGEMAGWYFGCHAENPLHGVCTLLCEVILELTKDIAAHESVYPELKPAFEKERADYRRMYDEAIEVMA